MQLFGRRESAEHFIEQPPSHSGHFLVGDAVHFHPLCEAVHCHSTYLLPSSVSGSGPIMSTLTTCKGNPALMVCKPALLFGTADFLVQQIAHVAHQSFTASVQPGQSNRSSIFSSPRWAERAPSCRHCRTSEWYLTGSTSCSSFSLPPGFHLHSTSFLTKSDLHCCNNKRHLACSHYRFGGGGFPLFTA